MKRALISLFALLFGAVGAQAQIDKISLNSDSKSIDWRLKPVVEVGRNPAAMFAADYSAKEWVKAVVPGATFVSFVEAGLEKDPNFGDNAYTVDKAKYDRDFWYRGEFAPIKVTEGETIWLNFEGINRKGDVYFNGQYLGLLDGFMHRGRFDITDLQAKDGKNVVAVLVHFVGNPVPNHASPTYISSAGWDWMPYVPGLLSGITDDVYLTKTRSVSIVDPWVRTKDVSAKQATLKMQLELSNNSDKDQTGVLKTVITPGDIEVSREFSIAAGKQREFLLSDVVVENPKLWWPNGYGDPNLYTCEMTFTVDGKVSDSRKMNFGIRDFKLELVDSVARIVVNGQPVYIKGANWGMSEYLLRCRGEEYFTKVNLHKEMNFNMIRNWIGSVTDDEFYDACDKYGIMVWDDFWLNSHQNLPDDVLAFNRNAVEKIKRLRNHASIALWCGDNEGYPIAPLNNWLAENVRVYDGGDRVYHANSNSDGLSGSGPWTNFHPTWYFSYYPRGYGKNVKNGWGLRSEIGTAVFTTFESFKKFMPEQNWWPRNEMWNKHFFGPSAGNGGPDTYFSTVEYNYGKAEGIEDFCRKAQLVNIEVNKAMYEGWQHHIWDDATAVMTWMGQSAYPSLVWQTYDYYYDLNGAYWGVKKACEPTHIQWSYADNSVKVINTTFNEIEDVTATAKVYNLDGREVKNYAVKNTFDVAANKDTYCFDMKFISDNLAHLKPAVASSVSVDASIPAAITDSSNGTRWASEPSDDQWIYIDMGAPTEIANIVLSWESAHAKSYKLQVSDDAKTWRDIYTEDDSQGGVEDIKIEPVVARYFKVLGLQRSSMWGYSLFEMELYGKTRKVTDLTDVHFIKLALTDKSGKLLSDNFYWRSNKQGDYKALNTLPAAKLKTTSTVVTREGKSYIRATVKNVGPSVAFAVHVQPVCAATGERILPMVMNENYFTLLRGESKVLEIEFDAKLMPKAGYKLAVTPYNCK